MGCHRLRYGSTGYSQIMISERKCNSKSRPRSHRQDVWCKTWGWHLYSGSLIPLLLTTRRPLPRLLQFHLPGLTSWNLFYVGGERYGSSRELVGSRVIRFTITKQSTRTKQTRKQDDLCRCYDLLICPLYRCRHDLDSNFRL